MPMILAPGRLRRTLVMSLRNRLERELLLTLSSVLLWETVSGGKKKKTSLNAWLHAVIKYFLSMALWPAQLNIRWIAK